MEEEYREQPVVMPANVSSETVDECAVSNTGSQQDISRQVEKPESSEFGKFKSAQALLDAYTNLESEFTKKCQKLSELEKDKRSESSTFDVESGLQSFLMKNSEALQFSDEIKNLISSDVSLQKVDNPYEVAWAKVVLRHVASQKIEDPIINRYLLSSDELKQKIVENYLDALKEQNCPIIISSQKGERVSSVTPDTPQSLKEAKIMVEKMFS